MVLKSNVIYVMNLSNYL